MTLYEIEWETKEIHKKRFSGSDDMEKALEAARRMLSTKPNVIDHSVEITPIKKKG